MGGALRKEGQPVPVVGNGNGASVTSQALTINTELGLSMDTPGIDDTALRFTDDEAGRRVAIGVAASGAEKLKFLVFESLANDAMHLRSTLESLIRAFGAVVLGATVVLATKKDRLDPVSGAERLELIDNIVQEQNLRGVVCWQNSGLDDAGQALQLATLQACLNSFEGVRTGDMEDLHQRQKLRAQQKCDAYPTQRRTVDVEVEEQYTEPRAVQEEYSEPYVEQVPHVESYDAPETYEEPEQHAYQYVKKHKGIGGKCGLTKTCTGYHTVMVQKVRMIPKTRTVMRDVTKYRAAYRTVTHYDTKSRKVTKQKEVEYRLTVDRFMDEALAEIVEEVRESLRQQ